MDNWAIDTTVSDFPVRWNGEVVQVHNVSRNPVHQRGKGERIPYWGLLQTRKKDGRVGYDGFVRRTYRTETAENGPSGDVGDSDDTTLGQIPKSASLPVKCVFAFESPDEEVSNAELVSRMVSRFGANPASVLPGDYVEGYDKYSKHGFLKRVSRWTYALSEKGRKLWEAGIGHRK